MAPTWLISSRLRVPVFRDFAVRYRERRTDVWTPSSLETFDIYMPHIGLTTLPARVEF